MNKRFKPFFTYLAIICLGFFAFSGIISTFIKVEIDIFNGQQSFAFGISDVGSLLGLFLGVAPCALLLGYVLKFFTHPKAGLIETIIFGLMGFWALYKLISALMVNASFDTYVFFYIIMILAFGAVAVQPFIKTNKIPFTLIASALGIVYAIYGITETFSFYTEIEANVGVINTDILTPC